MKNFKLIDGEFKVSEAKEVLLSLISSKIKFHNAKIFSDEERFGIRDQQSMDRIVELEKLRSEVIGMFADMEDQGQMFRISSQIIMEPISETESSR